MRTHLFTKRCAGLMLLLAQVVAAQATRSPNQSTSTPVTQQERDAQLQVPTSSDPGKQPFLRNFLRYEWRMWSSPFRKTSYDKPTVRKYIIPFALISTALIATDKKTADALPNTKDQAVWSGRVSQLGAGYTLAG